MKAKSTSKKTSSNSKNASKTSGKTTKKKSAVSGVARSSLKKAAAAGSGLKRTSKKIADKVLSAINPPLQQKIDQLIHTLETSREGRMGDLSLLAGKILIRAQEVSRSLRTFKKGKKTK
jgi:hypothetical protein